MRNHPNRSYTWSILGTLTLLTSILGAACGSSSDEDTGSSTSKSSQGDEAAVFTSQYAGEACADNAECGNGRCAQEFSGGLLGGSTQAPGGYCTFNCQLDADCGDGATCVGANSGAAFGLGGNTTGQCLLRCASSAECRDGYRCFDGLGQTLEAAGEQAGSGSCQVAPETDTLGGGVAGNACGQDEDCGGGRCMTSDLLMTAYPGGYCTGSCLANEDCGEGGVCATSFGGMAGTCYRSCEQDAECDREGYRCRASAFAQGGSMRCLPGSEPLPDGVVGTACAEAADCGGSQGSRCSQSLASAGGDQSAPGGYCSASCIEDADCGSDGRCVGAFGGITMGSCYQACAQASDCRDGYACEMPGIAGFGGFGGNFGTMGMGAMGAMLPEQPSVCTIPQASPDEDLDAGVP